MIAFIFGCAKWGKWRALGLTKCACPLGGGDARSDRFIVNGSCGVGAGKVTAGGGPGLAIADLILPHIISNSGAAGAGVTGPTGVGTDGVTGEGGTGPVTATFVLVRRNIRFGDRRGRFGARNRCNIMHTQRICAGSRAFARREQGATVQKY